MSTLAERRKRAKDLGRGGWERRITDLRTGRTAGADTVIPSTDGSLSVRVTGPVTEARRRELRRKLDIVAGKRKRPYDARKRMHELIPADVMARASWERLMSEGARPRYTPAEIQKLGEEGKALRTIKGRGYHYPIVDALDVTHAVEALGRAPLQERPTIRKWISKRARELKAMSRLPAHWPDN